MDSLARAKLHIRCSMQEVRSRHAVALAAGAAAILFAGQSVAQASCEASQHGMRADSSNNIAALTRTLTECAGRTIHIAQGTYTFSPQGFAKGLEVPAGTTIVGDGSQ